MHTVFIAGCGDVGERLARRYLDQGLPVAALARSAEAYSRLATQGITPVSGNLDSDEVIGPLPTDGAAVFYFVPPPPTGDADPRMTRFLAALAASGRPRVIVYLSTSGVYGDRQGEWVDERSEPDPQTGRARRRLDAETQVRHWGRQAGVPVVVLRVGGIYGPGRLPRERLERGEPVLRESECGFTNRIHVEDLVEVCRAAAERGGADEVYNVSDGRPGTMTEYFLAVAERLGLPRPPEIAMAEARKVLSPAMLSYLTESRRMDNRKLRERLGVELRYPSLAEGLADVSDAADGLSTAVDVTSR